MHTASSGNLIDTSAVISAAGLEAASRHALRASHHQQQQQHRSSQLRSTSESTRSGLINDNPTNRSNLSPERQARSSQSQGRHPDLSRRVTSPATPWTPPSPGPGVGGFDDLTLRATSKTLADPHRYRSKSLEDAGLAHPISLLETTETATIDEGDEDDLNMRHRRSTTDGRPSEADSAPPSTSGSFRQRSSVAHALTQPTPIVIALEPSTHVIAINHNSAVFPSTTVHAGGAAAFRKRNIPNKSYSHSHTHAQAHKPKPKRSHNSHTSNRAPSTSATAAAAAAAAAALAAANAIADGAAAVLVTRPDLGGIVVGAGPVPGLTLGSSTNKDLIIDASKVSSSRRSPRAAATAGRGLNIGRRLLRAPATSVAAAAASAARAAAAVAVSNSAISAAAPVWPLACGRSVQLHHHESFIARGPAGQLSAEATAASEIGLLTATSDSLTATNHEGFGLRRKGTDLLQLELLGAGRSHRGQKASKATQSPTQSPPRRQRSRSSSRGRSGGSSPRLHSAQHIAAVRHTLPNPVSSEYSLIRLDRDPSRISVVDSSTLSTNPFSIDLQHVGHSGIPSPQHSTNVFGIGNGLAADPSTLNSDLCWYPETSAPYPDAPLPSTRSAPHLVSASAGVSSGDDEEEAVARRLQYNSGTSNYHRAAACGGGVCGGSLGRGVESGCGGRAHWSVPGGGSLRPSMSMPVLPSQPSPDRSAARRHHTRTIAGGVGGFDISGYISLEELVAEWAVGSRPRPSSYPAPPLVVAVAPLVPPAADDPELNEALAKARRRAAEEKQKRRAAAAVAKAAKAAKAKAAAVRAAKAALLAGRPQGSTATTVASAKPSEQVESVGGNLTSRGSSKAAIAQVLFHHQAEDWARSRRQLPPRRRLAPDVTKMVEKWFALVDEDNSGKLQARALAAALRGAGLPCSESDIMDLVRSIDADHDGCISLNEFQSFLLRELGEGKNLTEGDYVLPSGKRLPFGAMIARLKRLKVLDDVMKGGKARNRYVDMLYNRHGTGNEIGLLPEEAAANLNALGGLPASPGGSGGDFGGNELAAAAAGAGRGGRVRLQTLFQQYRQRQQEALAPLLAVAEEPPPVLYPPLSYDTSDSDSDVYGDGVSGTARSAPFRSATRSVRETGPPGWASGEDDELDSDAIAAAAGFGEAVAGVSYFPRRSSSVSMLQSACSVRHREVCDISIPVGTFATVTAEPGDRTLVFQLTEVGLTQEVSSNPNSQQNNSPSTCDDSAPTTISTTADSGSNEDPAAPTPSDSYGDSTATDPTAMTTTAALATSAPSAVPTERSEGGYLTARSCPPAPLIPALPPVPRPNTRAFARALLDVRHCAPEYLVQRYGMPGPREAAAAAAAVGGRISPRGGTGTMWGRQRSSNGFENTVTSATGSLRPLVSTAPPGAIADGLHDTARSNGAATGVVNVPGTAPADVERNWALKASGAVTSQSEGTFPTASSLPTATTQSSAVLAATDSSANFTAYGAGFTRYKRWTMYEIDPAAENPDYWQAKAAALLMRRTRKAFQGVQHSGFAVASAAVAAATAVAAAQAAARDLDLGGSSSVGAAAAAINMDSGAAVAGVPETSTSAVMETMMLPGAASPPPSGANGVKPVFHLPNLPLTGSSHTTSGLRPGDVISSSNLRAESSRLHVPVVSTGTLHHTGLGPAGSGTAALAGSSTTGVSGVHGRATGLSPRGPHLTDRPVVDAGGSVMSPRIALLSPGRLKRNLSRGHASGVSNVNDGCPMQYVVRPQHGAPARLPGTSGESPRRRRPPPAPPGGGAAAAAAAAAAASVLMMTVGGSMVESPSSPPRTAPQSPPLRQSPSKRNLPSPCTSSPLPLVQQPSPQRRRAMSLPPLVAIVPAPTGPPN